MVTPLERYLALVGLVALERLAELVVSERNARRMLAAGGVEAGRGHYAPMVLLHALLLLSCAVEASLRPPPPAALAEAAVAGVASAQALRWWAVASLGGRWSTRVIVPPGAAPVTAGPYRWMRHPNYLAVVVELLALPLAFGCWATAVGFSLANAAVLAVRIRAEERALGASWEAAFRGRRRFVPGRPA